MPTLPWKRVAAGGLALGLTAVLVGSTDPPAVLKAPAYLLIRGPGLDHPVVLHNGPGGHNWALDGSEVVRLIQSRGEQAPAPVGSRYYEVFEFWRSSLTPEPSADGSPSGPLVPEYASAVSRIYADEPGGPIWNPYLQPIGDPSLLVFPPPEDGIEAVRARQEWLARRVDEAHRAPPVESTAEYRRLSPTGIALLESHGLRFGN
jgi:hypothetical protein